PASAIHLTHPARADLLDETVMTEGGFGRKTFGHFVVERCYSVAQIPATCLALSLRENALSEVRIQQQIARLCAVEKDEVFPKFLQERFPEHLRVSSLLPCREV